MLHSRSSFNERTKIKYSAFEQGCPEADTGLKELMRRLHSFQEKREMSDLLLTSARRLLSNNPLKPDFSRQRSQPGQRNPLRTTIGAGFVCEQPA